MAQAVVSTKTPKEAYMGMVQKGKDLADYTSAMIFFQSFYAGCYIGFGALLATKISEAVPGMTDGGGNPAEANPGLKSFIFAGLFPVNLLLILLSGGILFTGSAACAPAAVLEGKIPVSQAARILGISWWGNMLGSALFAVFTQQCEILEGSTARGMVNITVKKTSKSFWATFLKGIGCNWCVCMAVFLCGMAQDMTGKYVGIWLPISCFVMCGFEHIPANFYITWCGAIAEMDKIVKGENPERPFDMMDIVIKNWLPTTLGNFVAGAVCVAAGYSYAYGGLANKVMGNKEAPAAPANKA